MNLFMLDGEHVRLTKRGASNMRQAESQGTQRRFGSLSAAVWRDTSALVPSDGSRHYCR